jgi:YbgC/YbaW family acyl-CoA thioester hydrolase
MTPQQHGAVRPAHVEQLRVPWADTDASGRIHWSTPFRWVEIAEHRLWSTLGRDRNDAGSCPRRAAQVTFHCALEFDDPVEVQLSVEKLGRTSMTFSWLILRGAEVCIEGRHTVVHVEGDGRPAPWPDELRTALAQARSAVTESSQSRSAFPASSA